MTATFQNRTAAFLWGFACCIMRLPHEPLSPLTSLETIMLYMIVEHFKNDDPIPVYRRFRDRGRLAPDGLQYVSSWVDEKLERCFQIMETSNRKLLDQWIARWSDIVEFDVFPIISSKEAAEKIAPLL